MPQVVVRSARTIGLMAGFALAALPVAAQLTETQAGTTGSEYAVKFVCGSPHVPVVAPGQYSTAINVHNPSSRLARFKKKIAVALPGEKGGRP